LSDFFGAFSPLSHPGLEQRFQSENFELRLRQKFFARRHATMIDLLSAFDAIAADSFRLAGNRASADSAHH